MLDFITVSGDERAQRSWMEWTRSDYFLIEYCSKNELLIGHEKINIMHNQLFER